MRRAEPPAAPPAAERPRPRPHGTLGPGARDLALGVGLVLWNSLYTTYVHPDSGERVWPYDRPSTYLLVLLGVWVVVVGRRSRPGTTVVACAVLDLLLRGTDAASDPLPTACAAFAVMQYRHGPRRPVAVGLAMLVFVASVPLADRSLDGLVVALSTIAASAATGHVSARHRSAAAQAEQAALLRLRAAEQAVALTVAHERQMVAREMHDVLSHGVAVMVRLSEAARVLGDQDDDDRRRDALLSEVSATGRGAVADMRRLLHVDGSPPDGSGFEPTLSDSLEALGRRARLAGLPVELEVDEPLIARCSTAARRLVARAVQEGLTNAFRYADGATRVAVRVRGGDAAAQAAGSSARVVVEVEDDGAGAAVPLQGTLSGLIGLDEGARAVGGRVEAGPRADLGGLGWRLVMTLPERELP